MVESFRDQDDPRVQEMRQHLANCLRLVGSVVEFRLERAEHPEGRAHLGWVLDKVTAIALVQRRLAEQPDFEAYLDQVADFWRRNSQARGLTVSARADPVDLPPEHSAAIAVMVHELVGNCVRHAFPAGGGSISIDLRAGEDRIELVIRDDGVGAGSRGADDTGGGLRLVERLARELEGSFELDAADGTVARVMLPLARGTESSG